jgi:predicted alpha/beta-fold hydrolase
MVENDGDDNIFFNKQNLPKIITITKEKTLKDKKPESIIIINKGSNKIHLNLKNKSNKINREDIIDSLKMIKKIQLESVDDYYGKNKLNISSYKFIKSCQKKLLIIGNKDDMKKKNMIMI